MKRIQRLIVGLIFQTISLLSLSCGSDDTPTINPNIVQLTDLSGFQFAADWNEDGIVGIGGPTDLYDPNEAPYDSFYESICDSSLDNMFPRDEFIVRFVSVSDYDNKALLVNSNSRGQSIGSLIVWNYGACEVETLRESSFNISSAHYTLGEEIIYYSFGNSIHHTAGYYWLKSTPEKDSLIYPYLSDLGQYEVVNGFDVHPNGTQLIIPLVGRGRTPLIAVYEMNSGILDILDIDLDVSRRRFNLWLRYNSNGDHLLYCTYSPGVLIGAAGDISEIGVINLSDFKSYILKVNTAPVYQTMSLFPNWSPGNTSIVYGTTDYYTNNGGVGDNYSLYILNNIQ